MSGMNLDMSNAQMIRDENGRPFIVVREYASSYPSSAQKHLPLTSFSFQ